LGAAWEYRVPEIPVVALECKRVEAEAVMEAEVGKMRGERRRLTNRDLKAVLTGTLLHTRQLASKREVGERRR
jgi:hypothetical protein